LTVWERLSVIGGKLRLIKKLALWIARKSPSDRWERKIRTKELKKEGEGEGVGGLNEGGIEGREKRKEKNMGIKGRY